MMLLALVLVSSILLLTTTAEDELTGLSFGCGNVSLSCSPEQLLVVERVSYIHGTECQQPTVPNSDKLKENVKRHSDLNNPYIGPVQTDLYNPYTGPVQTDKISNPLHRSFILENIVNLKSESNSVSLPSSGQLITEGGKGEPEQDAGQPGLGGGVAGGQPGLVDDVDEDGVEVWDAVVSKCAGYKREDCRFQIQSRLPHLRPNGRLEVQYTCAKNVYSYCGGNVQAKSTGYISSPGYPKYYLGGEPCIWNLTTGVGQHLQITLLDTALRTSDCVEIQADGETKARECGRLSKIKQIKSSGNSFQIRTVNSGADNFLQARRGVLLRYKVIGCSAPPPIADGRVLFSNGSYAEFACDQDHVFKSTLNSFKAVFCRENVWSSPLEHCVSIDFLLQYGGDEIKQSLLFSTQKLTQSEQNSGGGFGWEMAALLVVGVILVISLSIAIILYLKYNQEHNYLIQDDQIDMKEIQHSKVEDSERY